jgi:acid phosphatase type 7
MKLVATIFCAMAAVATASHGSQDQPTAADSPNRVVLVGAGDIANCAHLEGAEATAKLLDTIAGTVFTVGDHAYATGTLREFERCYAPTWGRHKARTRPSPGNHDYMTNEGRAYYAYFGENAGPPGRGYYSYNLGAWHIISLNSGIDADFASDQIRWLRNDLRTNSTTCTLAYWHIPMFSSGTHGNDPVMKEGWEALFDFGVDVVINGHDHHYERFALQDPNGNAAPGRGIRQFIVGTGGNGLYRFNGIRANSEVRHNTAYGVLKLTLDPASYGWEFIPVAGQSFSDSGSAPCVRVGR